MDRSSRPCMRAADLPGRWGAAGLILALALAAPLSVAAQELALSFNEEWRWADYDGTDGVPPGRPIQMAHDGRHTWLLTQSGLAWFDDYRWRPIAGIDASPYRAIAAADGQVALMLDQRLYRVTRSADGLPTGIAPILDETVTGFLDLAWGPKGVLHVVRELEDQAVLLRVIGGVMERVELPEAMDLPLPASLQSSEDGLLVSTAAGLRLVRADGSFGLILDRPNDAFDIFRGSNEAQGMAFARYSLGDRYLVEWGPDGVRSIPSEGTNIVRSAVFSRGEYDLINWDTGTLRYREDGAWRSVSLPGDRLQGLITVFLEPSGDLWFGGVNRMHLFRTSDARWTRLESDFHSLDNRVNSLLYENGAVIFGTAGGLSFRQPNGETSSLRTILGSPVRTVTGIQRDTQGRLLIGSGSAFPGLLRQDRTGQWERLGAEYGLDAPVHQLARSPSGEIYAAALRGGGGPAGVYRLDSDRAVYLSEGVEIHREGVYAIDFSSDGSIWVGSFQGLARLDTSGTWSEWPKASLGVPARRIFDLAVGPDDRVWMSTGYEAGFPLSWFDPVTETAGRATAEVHPATDGVLDLTFDQAGRLWTTTVRGVGYDSPLGWTLLDHRTGFRGELAWPIIPTPASVFIGTAAGLQILDLAAARSGRPVASEVRTEYEPGRMEFEWVAHAYRGAMKSRDVETRYRLDGGEWSAWSAERQATFDRPQQGQHELEVQPRGLAGQTGASLRMVAVVPATLLLRPSIGIPLVTLLILLTAVSAVAVARKRERDRAVRESERRLRAYLEQAPEAILLFDMHRRRVVDGNDKACSLLGRTRADTVGMVLPDFDSHTDVPGEENLSELMEQAAAENRPIDSRRHLRRADSVRIPVQILLTRLPEPESHLIRISLVDRSEQEEAERQRKVIEVQLVQAQKLEAVGQLTGGIAHDFNNLLMVVQGNLELLRNQLQGDTRRYADQALHAAERGGQLVKRLLAFSMRQSLAPQALDPVDALQDLMPLLERTLGVRFQLEMMAEHPIAAIVADVAQLDSAILNCCINARDSMPEGGRISIRVRLEAVPNEVAEAADVEAGDYVRISIEDSGTGIPPEVLNHVFEPFFTTKEVGKGSGLGLSMV